MDLKSASKADPTSFVTGSLEIGYNILDEIPINCDELCDELSEALIANNELMGRFVHQGTDTIKLIELITQ